MSQAIFKWTKALPVRSYSQLPKTQTTFPSAWRRASTITMGNRRGKKTLGSAQQLQNNNAASGSGNRSPNLNRQASTAAMAAPQTAANEAIPASAVPTPAKTSRFADLKGVIDPALLKTITEDMKFDEMTAVQAATIHELIPTRNDILAQAKTGTGKTVAFLLPAIQTMLEKKPAAGQYISLLVISPTRELAIQIANEAKVLLQRFEERSVCLGIGGTNKSTEERAIRRGCDILVATPGRLVDHLTAEDEDGDGPTLVHQRLQRLDTLVLDEADRMLDMGFLPSLKQIIRCLPDKQASKRQGMLFSATIAEHVNKVAHLICNKDYKFVSTIPKGEVNTHERVPQHLIVVPNFSDLTAGLVGALSQEISHIGRDTFKAIIFAPTAAQVDYYMEILGKLPNMPPLVALHARMPQGRRTKNSDSFRQAKNGILVATDVVARGLDFPSVTNVIQVGIPADKESYIHRLGRTARAGAEGRGTFIVTSHERFFPKYTLKEITFNESPADLSAKGDVMRISERLETHAKTYQAWLGYYKAHQKALKWDPAELVRQANSFAREGLGAPEVPSINKSTVGKMGLRGTPGLVVVPDPPRAGRGGASRPPPATDESSNKRFKAFA